MHIPSRPNSFIEDPPEGDGDGGKGGGGGAEALAAFEQRMAAAEKANGLLAEGITTMNTALQSLTAKLETMGQQGDGGSKGGGGGDDDDVDLETMDRKTYTAYITKQMQGIVEGALKPVKDSFGKLDEKIDGHGLSTMIKEFSKDHPDFFEWRDEMRALVKETPTLSPARAYMLARAEADPVKVKKIDEKYGLNKKETSQGGDIFSMFPGSGSNGSATKNQGKMNAKDAAGAAWDQVMSQMSQASH